MITTTTRIDRPLQAIFSMMMRHINQYSIIKIRSNGEYTHIKPVVLGLILFVIN